MEQGVEQHRAIDIQQKIGYGLFFLSVAFYTVIFFFRRETMAVIFDKGSKIFSVLKEPLFRFSSTTRGHVPFQEITGIEKVPASALPQTPHGRIVIKAKGMPTALQAVEFKVLTDEQYEYFPENIERILGI